MLHMLRRVRLSALVTPARAISGSAARLGEFSDVLYFELAMGGALGPAELEDKAVLVVNTASRCGHAAQLAALQALHEAYAARGLVVVAVPSGDFGAQELDGADADVAAVYSASPFGVRFPVARKTSVVGERAHPFFARVVAEYGRSVAPTWNFDKFLVDHYGDLRAVFPHDTDPGEPEVAEAIQEVLDDLPRPLVPDAALVAEGERSEEQEEQDDRRG
jgi:glutathione peroxidase